MTRKTCRPSGSVNPARRAIRVAKYDLPAVRRENCTLPPRLRKQAVVLFADARAAIIGATAAARSAGGGRSAGGP